MTRTNCLCIDESEHSLYTFNWYLEHFHRTDDIVNLIHITELPQLANMGVHVGGSIALDNKMQENIKKTKEASQQLVEKFTNICDEHKVRYKLLLSEDHHSPGQIICKIAKENNADTIVLGQRGLSQFCRSLLGSTSDYVLHNSEVPIIVIPPKK